MIRVWTAIALLFLVACGEEKASTVLDPANMQRGVDAYEAGDYATAAEALRPFAEQGVAEAQYRLGRLYADGKAVTRDYVEAKRLFNLAAHQGHPLALNVLGQMFKYGWWDTEPNDIAAFQWLILAAHMDAPAAVINSSMMDLPERMSEGDMDAATTLANAWLDAFERRQAD